MSLANLLRDRVAILEQAIELSARIARAEQTTERAEGQLVVDVVGQRAALRVDRRHDVTVQPSRERPPHHAIGEHATGLVLDVLGDDRLRHEAHARAQDHAGADRERRRRLHDLDPLPGRGQPFERIGPLVEGEDRRCGRPDDRGFHESHRREWYIDEARTAEAC